MAKLKKNGPAFRSILVWPVVSIALACAVLAALMAVRPHAGANPEPPPGAAQATILSQYAGSTSCRECHRDEYADWANSHHGLAEKIAGSNSPAFDAAKTDAHNSPPFEMAVREGQCLITASGAGATRETSPVDRVIGHDPLVQFLVGAPGGRWQAFNPAWDPRQREWFNVFAPEERLPGEWGHWTGRGMNWNSMCAFCHNTRLQKNYDQATDTYHTAMAERSVGCEACHGPAQSHVKWQHQDGKSGRHDPTLAPMSRRQRLDACGACHARRSELTGDFKPGDDFQDHFELTMVDGTDLYYPDGQVQDEDYEYASFLSSRMGASGIECADCHQPHSARTRLPGNFLCVRCHDGTYKGAPIINPVSHSHHQVHGYNAQGKLVDTDLAHFQTGDIKETGGECVNCHMPAKVYMRRQPRHDHGLTIPDPLLTKEYGIPNACNRCHQDKDTDWALAKVNGWYGKRMERPSRQRARCIASARATDSAALQPLLKILAVETNSYWKAAILNLLPAWSAEPEVDAVLRQSLSDTNALVREKAARALGAPLESQSAATTAALRARLGDPVRSVRVAAAWALRAGLELNSDVGRELNLFFDSNADQPGGQLQIGEFFAARGESETALKHYRQAMAWDPLSAVIRHDLAILYSSQQKNGEALEQVREAVRLEPREAEYHFSLALALNNAGELGEAITELREAVRLNPRHADAWRNLGLALAAKNDLSGAAEALARAEATDPGDPRAPYALATVFVRLGRMADARAAAERALQLRPDYTEARELIERLNSQNR